MFVSTGPDIHSVARSCLHEPGGHVVGVRLPDGSFLSRTTAEYPPQLARALATIIRPFVTSGAEVLQVAEWRYFTSPADWPSFAARIEDRGGLPSSGLNVAPLA
jgi:hypothetical protein